MYAQLPDWPHLLQCKYIDLGITDGKGCSFLGVKGYGNFFQTEVKNRGTSLLFSVCTSVIGTIAPCYNNAAGNLGFCCYPLSNFP